MAMTVSPQITDAVSQSTLSVLGQAASQAVAVAMQASAHGAALRGDTQQGASARMALLRQAVTARAVAGLTS